MFISLALLTIFLLGLYYYVIYNDSEYEGMRLMSGSSTARCPNILVQQGHRYQLYNSKLDKVPGVNPIEFENLESYTEFLNWQHSQGIRCPVLYLQKSYDIHGEAGYKIRDNVHDLKGGTPSSSVTITDSPQTVSIPVQGNSPVLVPVPVPAPACKPLPENISDPYDLSSSPCNNATTSNSPVLKDASFVTAEVPVPFYISSKPYDSSDQSTTTMEKSPNPMDPNWGGAGFTQKLVDQGFYQGNEITRL
jgi:hypothetical protein